MQFYNQLTQGVDKLVQSQALGVTKRAKWQILRMFSSHT